jgi:thiol-disulfide isomerase/thioredoxin
MKLSLRFRQMLAMFIATTGYCFSIHAQPMVKDSFKDFSPKVSVTYPVREIEVGERIPEIFLKNIYNYPSSTAKISDFQDKKLLLLDFWATGCSSCIEGFPKMQALQTKYKDQLQVLLVNAYYGDNEKKVTNFFEKRKAHTGESFYLPYTLQDSTLLSYFPLQFIPHLVWIDKTGMVVGITSQTEITESNVQSILEGKAVKLKRKNDRLVYDSELPLLTYGNGGDETDFQLRTIITGYKEGLGASIGNKPAGNGKISKFYVINYPVFQLYQMAYNDVLKYPPNRTFIEVDNPDIFLLKKNDDDNNENKYCYETIMPPATLTEAIQYMRDDLSRFFHAIVKNETREMGIYSLVANGKIKNLYTKGGKPEIDVYKLSLKKHIHNRPVSDLVEMLNYLMDKPVIDNTGIIQNIDIEFPDDFSNYDLKQLKSFFSKKGFEFVPEKKNLEVAVITSK